MAVGVSGARFRPAASRVVMECGTVPEPAPILRHKAAAKTVRARILSQGIVLPSHAVSIKQTKMTALFKKLLDRFP